MIFLKSIDDFILFINSQPVADDTIVDFQIPDKEKSKVKEISNVIAKRMNKLQRQRSKRKREAKKAAPKSEKEKKKQADIDIKNAIKSYNNLLKAGIITKKEFDKKKSDNTIHNEKIEVIKIKSGTYSGMELSDYLNKSIFIIRFEK